MQEHPMLHAWCQQQLFYWQNRTLKYDVALAEYHRHNETQHGLFLFRFSGENVFIVDKPAALAGVSGMLYDRASSYLAFFRKLASGLKVQKEFILALEVGDGAFVSETAPIFSFQKSSGQTALLLNDVNLIEGEFYSAPVFTDQIDYSEKLSKAAFIGSTSGMHNSPESVLARTNPRIDAGLFFRDSPDVDFKLPNIVQCEPEAEVLIRSLGFGSEAYMSWHDQFAYKFLISMDGNGATCQRLAIALQSNCAILKYNSFSELYYFSGLIPWYHYVPVARHQDVLEAIRLERTDPRIFQDIAENSKLFFQQFLTDEAVSKYASLIISGYINLFENTP